MRNHRITASLVLSLAAAPAVAYGQGYGPPPEDYGGTGQVTESRRPQGGGGPGILRPSTRPMWLVGGFGPDLYDLNFGGTRPPGSRSDDFFTRVILVADFGYHFSGDGEGPAIGGAIEQTFGSSLYTFNPAGKFWWDIQITDMAIYVAPFGKLGYILGSAGGQVAHGLNLGLGAEGRVVLDDRWMLFARPGQLDLIFGDFAGDSFTASLSFLIGGGATF